MFPTPRHTEKMFLLASIEALAPIFDVSGPSASEFLIFFLPSPLFFFFRFSHFSPIASPRARATPQHARTSRRERAEN